MLLSAQCSNAVPVGKWTSVFFKSSNGFGFRGPSIPRCAKFTRAACTSLNPGPGGNRKYRWFVDIQSSTQAFPFSNRWAKYFKSKDPWAARWWQNHKNQSDHINNFQVQAVVKQISQMAGWTCQFSATYCLLPSSGFWSDRQNRPRHLAVGMSLSLLQKFLHGFTVGQNHRFVWLLGSECHFGSKPRKK